MIINTQVCVTLSSSKAEYVALANFAEEVLQLRMLLDFLRRWPPNLRVKHLEDSEGTMKLASNSIRTTRTKHMNARFHSPREHVVEGKIGLAHVNTQEQVADALSKNLSAETHSNHRKAPLN